MRINFKQQKLIDGLLKALKKNFPDVKFVDITETLKFINGKTSYEYSNF